MVGGALMDPGSLGSLAGLPVLSLEPLAWVRVLTPPVFTLTLGP